MSHYKGWTKTNHHGLLYYVSLRLWRLYSFLSNRKFFLIREITIWVSWEIACRLKNMWRLGIKDLGLFIEALLGKWRWIFFSKRVLCGWKFLSQSMGVGGAEWRVKWPTKLPFGGEICVVCSGGLSEGKWFDSNMEWKVGISTRMRFWEDNWLRGDPLVITYLRLYIILLQQQKSVSELGTSRLWCNPTRKGIG